MSRRYHRSLCCVEEPRRKRPRISGKQKSLPFAAGWEWEVL